MSRTIHIDSLSQARPQLLQLSIAGLTDVTVAISQRIIDPSLWPDNETGLILVATEYERLFFENQLPPILPRIIMVADKGGKLMLQDACPLNRTPDEVMQFVQHMWRECDADSDILGRFSFSEAYTVFQEKSEPSSAQLSLVSVLKTTKGWQQLRVQGFDRLEGSNKQTSHPIVRTMCPEDPENSETFESVFTIGVDGDGSES